MLVPCLKSKFGLVLTIIKVEIFLEQREVAFLSSSKISGCFVAHIKAKIHVAWPKLNLV